MFGLRKAHEISEGQKMSHTTLSERGLPFCPLIKIKDNSLPETWEVSASPETSQVNHCGTAGVSTDPEHYRVLPS